MSEVGSLRKFSLFRELDEAQLEKFVPHIQERNYPTDSLICSQGERSDELFFVKQGKVSVVLPLHRYDSQYKTISEIDEGGFFGELSFFDGQERSAYVKAEGDVKLLVLSRYAYDRIIQENLKEGCRIQSKIVAGLTGIIREMNETYSSANFLV